jgi:5-carboxymethyl-2-hydroxymuconate isomerase
MKEAVTDSATALLRAIRAALGDAGLFVLEEIKSRAWASITFSGARHELAFRLEGAAASEAAGRFLGSLRAAEFALRGHIVADIALVAEERRPNCASIRLEALTVEEA